MSLSKSQLRSMCSFAIIFLFVSCQQTKKISIPEQFKSIQVIVVSTASDTATTGTLAFFNKKGKEWIQVLEDIPVNVGKTGIIWGQGLHTGLLHGIKNQKKEGDGKTPAGIFYLGSAFGYDDPESFTNSNYSYLKVDSSAICVDDPHSAFYNQVINKDKNPKDWHSQEFMRRQDNLYKRGIFVAYNDNPAMRGAGSCIFLHIWRGYHSPTAGCISMAEENLAKVTAQLDQQSKPIIIIGTRKQLDTIRSSILIPK